MFSHIKDLIKKITPLDRYNVSPGLDKALEILRKTYPELIIHSYKTGEVVWDWIIPKKWELKSSRLSCNGEPIFSNFDHPLRVWSGSWPTEKSLTFKELQTHLLFDNDTPDLIPWNYKYYQHSSEFWGFSLTKKEYFSLKKNCTYDINIDSRFYDDDLRMGTIMLPGESDDIFIISSDICHPGQANDSLSGVACALYVYEKLKKKNKRHYSFLLTFQPEMIGTIAFLANNEDLIKKIQYGLYSEMMGTNGKIALQHSLSKNTRIDAISLQVLLDRFKENIECKDFLDNCIVNDELILNHVGVHIPTIAINRGTFLQYHTSGDNYDLLDWDVLLEGAEAIFEIVNTMDNGKYRSSEFERIPPRKSVANRYQKNQIEYEVSRGDFIPVPKFKGPIFLSKRGLYVDWREDPKLNSIMDKILVSMNGVNTCSDISKYCGIEFETIVGLVENFFDQDLIEN